MEHQHRSFFQLYGDAIWHAHQAISIGESPSVAAEKATRASIITSAITLECAANCALQLIDLSKSSQDGIDKLPPVAKLEIVARLRGSQFDSGDARVAAMRELVTLRNDYAHPKINKIPTRISGMSETDIHHHVELEHTGKPLSNLGIDRISKFWFPKCAVKVLEKSTDFYNWYFLESLGLLEKEVLGILAPLLFLTEDKESAYIFQQSCFTDELALLDRLKIKNEFINFSGYPQA